MGRLAIIGNASGAADVRFGADELWHSNRTVSGFSPLAFSAAHTAAAGHRRIESGTATGKLVRAM